MQIELKTLQNETGITFIFVTHDQEEALTMSDRIAVMSAGRILQVGSPRDIYDRPAERFVADFIGESNFLPATIASKAGSQATVRLASGAEIPASLPDGFAPTGQVSIVIRPEHAQLAIRPKRARRWPAHWRISSISARTPTSTSSWIPASPSSCGGRTRAAIPTGMRRAIASGCSFPPTPPRS